MAVAEKRDLTSYALYAIPIALLFFNPLYFDAFNIGKLIPLLALGLALAITLLITLFLGMRKNQSFNPKSRDTYPYIGFFAIIVIAGSTSTENIWRLLLGMPGRNNGLIYYFVVSMFSLIVLLFKSSYAHERRVSRILDFSGFLLISYSLVQFLGQDPFKWEGSQNPIIGTFGNANFSAAALGSFAIYFFIRTDYKKPAQAISGASTSVLAAFLAWKTDSIQGPLIFVVGLSLFGVIQLGRKWKNIRVAYFSLFVLGIIGILTFTAFLGLGPLGNQLEQYTLRLRFFYSQIGLKIMMEHPFFGIGSDSYLIGFLENRTIEFVREYGFGVVTNNAHSVPVQIGATFGIFAFVMYSFIMLKTCLLCMRELLQNSRLTRESQAIFIFWMVLFFQSLLSIEQLGLGVTIWILGAYILRWVRDNAVSDLQGKRNSVPRNERSYGEAIILLSLLFSLLTSIPYGREDRARQNLIALQTSQSSVSEEDREFIDSQYARITSMTLSEPVLITPILEKLYLVNNIGEIGRLSQKLVESNPQDYYAWETLATYYQIISDKEKLMSALKRMILLDPVNVDAILKAAKLSKELGLRPEVKALALRVLSIAPESPQADEANLLLDEVVE
jgi:hypothetical protein